MKNIIVVDDDKMMRNMIRDMLDYKYEITMAESVEDVLNICKTKKIDLVITDLFMPHKSGLDLIEEVKKQFSYIKLLAISGGSRLKQCDFLPVAEIMGAHQILKKPFNMLELKEKVALLLEEKQYSS